MRSILVGVAFAALATGASAQDKRPDYGTAINAAGAKKIAAGVRCRMPEERMERGCCGGR